MPLIPIKGGTDMDEWCIVELQGHVVPSGPEEAVDNLDIGELTLQKVCDAR